MSLVVLPGLTWQNFIMEASNMFILTLLAVCIYSLITMRFQCGSCQDTLLAMILAMQLWYPVSGIAESMLGVGYMMVVNPKAL